MTISTSKTVKAQIATISETDYNARMIEALQVKETISVGGVISAVGSATIASLPIIVWAPEIVRFATKFFG